MKVSRNFKIQEFVPRDIYEQFGRDSIHFVSDFQVKVAQKIRDLTGKPTVVNTWNSGGNLQYRGYRPPFCKIGAKKSLHKFSMAIDLHVVGMSIKELYDLVMEHEEEFYALGVRRIEDIKYTPSWLHLDQKNKGLDYITTFAP